MTARRRTSPHKTTTILTVMVGNSRTAVMRWSSAGEAIGRGAWPTESGGQALVERIRAAVSKGSAAVVVAGVVPSAMRTLERRLSSLLPPLSSFLLRFRKDLPCCLRILPRPARCVGDDRLAAALGALTLDARVPWVVLDAGTALTVNSVRPCTAAGSVGIGGVFEGGLIVPGEQLALLALSGGTAQLPALTPQVSKRSVPVWGRSTEEAIRFGVRRAQIAAACELARAQARSLGRRTRVALTGGGADALWPAIRGELGSCAPVLVPDLVHRGLLACLIHHGVH